MIADCPGSLRGLSGLPPFIFSPITYIGVCYAASTNMCRRSFWVIAISIGVAFAANWPQWRGPNLDGSTKGAQDLPVTWTEKDNVLWRLKTPNWSAATPIVWEQTVFITSAEP